jgi:predicted acyltransferase
MKKFWSLAAAGAVLTAAGLAFSLRDPIIKHIWSASFTIFSSGLCYVILALFYLIVDVLGAKRWVFFFIVIGSNALFIYVLTGVIFGNLNAHQVKMLQSMPLYYAGPLFLLYFATLWTMLYILYKKKIYLRV